MHDVAEFLKAHEPFSGLDKTDLDRLAAHANRSAAGDAEISAAGAAVRALVISSREDLEIAHQTREALARGPRG